MPRLSGTVRALALLALALRPVAGAAPDALWPFPTLRIAPPYDGAVRYDRRAFSYPPAVEGRAARLYDLRSMYTDHPFRSIEESQIEHLVPLADAFRSGAWAWPAAKKRAFARDGLNIVLAQPSVNRAKSAHTPDEWLPPKNRCFFALQWTAVKLKWGLSVTPAEWGALRAVLAGCAGAGPPPAKGVLK